MNEKENHLPNLSDKERAHGLELAMKWNVSVLRR